MKKLISACLLSLICTASMAQGELQNIVVDTTKYAGYQPKWNPDYRLAQPNGNSKSAAKSGRKGAKDAVALPDHWNSAESKHFPPIFNQGSLGSCGVSSHVGYMLTHEMNAYNDADGSLPENQLAPLFEYPFTYHGPGKDEMALEVGFPNAVHYGGRYTSSIYLAKEHNTDDWSWVQGYDIFYDAMKHRITHAANFPNGTQTEGGKLDVKRWLYNHNGDEDFGGRPAVCCMGVGIGSSGTRAIPSSTTNDALGVTGMRYMDHWNVGGADHAMTIVGWDDRVEFDLDGNGTAGETSNSVGQNEMGAWILANTWGGWANSGFVYCPYAMGGPTSKYAYEEDGVTKKTRADDGEPIYLLTGGWTPYVYYYNKGYTPSRTMRVKMTYSKRSEISVKAGVSNNVVATRPDKTYQFAYINYTGDGNNDGADANTPLLGTWADGRSHTEAMEFGIDITKLTAGYDDSKPLKYFLVINSKSGATGEGKVYEASIIDYLVDAGGIEFPCTTLGDGVAIENDGETTYISWLVQGEEYFSPNNLRLSGNTLSWEAPVSSHTISGYNVYENGSLLGTTSSTSYVLSSNTGSYSVCTVYDVAGDEKLSAQSRTVSLPMTSAEAYEDDHQITLSAGGFTIPDITSTAHDDFTLEYWFKPGRLSNWNNKIAGPEWSKFLIHTNADGTLAAGWYTGEDRLDVTSPKLTVDTWVHMAYVINGSNLKVYYDGTLVGELTSPNKSGFPIFSEGLVIGNGSGVNAQMTGVMDEVKVWNTARTQAQIQQFMNLPIVNPSGTDGLLAYFKGGKYAELGSTGTQVVGTTAESSWSANGTYYNNTGGTLNPSNDTWGARWVSTATTPQVTVTSSEDGSSLNNKMNITNGRIWNSSSGWARYKISVNSGYAVTGYTLTVKVPEGKPTVTFTPAEGGDAITVAAGETKTLSASDILDKESYFTMTSTGQSLAIVSNFSVDYVEAGEIKLRDYAGGHHASYNNLVTTDGTKIDATATAAFTVQGNSETRTNVYNTYYLRDAEWATDIAWYIDGVEQTNLRKCHEADIAFDAAGSKTLRIEATRGNGSKVTVNKSVSVSENLFTSDFTLTATTVKVNERISFLSSNSVAGCTYEWTMRDGTTQSATSKNAATSYSTQGSKTVILKVTDPQGNVASTIHRVEVLPSAPVAKSSLSANVIMKNNSVTLTDESLYSPTEWSWRLASYNNQILETTENPTINIARPGIYTIYHGAKNSEGEDFETLTNRLYVCNMASGNGLGFSDGRTVNGVLPSTLSTAWTVEYWFKPTSLADNMTHFTGSNSSDFTMKVNSEGAMTLSVGTDNAISPTGYYASNEFHHYAITFSEGTLKYYRDGQLYSTSTGMETTDFSTYFKNFQIGVAENAAAGVIDEFRIWNTCRSQSEIQSYAAQTISDVATAQSNGLKVYYQFNQTGNVNITDATSNNITGTHAHSKGLLGDGWTTSDGVFALDFTIPTAADYTAGLSLVPTASYNVIAVSDEEKHSFESSKRVAEYAFDGEENNDSFWHSRWVSQVNYPHSVTIHRVQLDELKALVVSDRGSSYRPASVKVEQSSDNINWEVVDEFIPLYNVSNASAKFSKALTKEYLRFSFPTGHGGHLAIKELKLYGTTVEERNFNTVSLSYIGVSDQDAISVGSNALDTGDGYLSTKWHSQWAGNGSSEHIAYPHWIIFENTEYATKAIEQLEILSDESEMCRRPARFDVLVSDDNVTYTELMTDVRMPFGRTSRVILPEPITSRYVKLKFTSSQLMPNNGATEYLTINNIKAYSTEIPTETLEDVRQALQDAVDEGSLYLGKIGSGLGQYSGIDESSLEYKLSSAATVKTGTSKSFIKEYTSIITDALAGVTMNMPERNQFYYLKSYDNAYLRSAAAGKTLGIGTKTAASIFYLTTDGKLLSYDNGYFTYNVSNMGALGEATPLVIEEASEKGYYAFQNSSNYLFGSGDLAIVNKTTENSLDETKWSIEPVTSLPVAISSAGYATFNAPVALTIPSGLRAYTGTDNGETLHLDEVSGTLPKNTPVILKTDSETSGNFDLDLTDDVDAITGNALTGTIEAEPVPVEKIYTLQKKNGKVGFYRYSGGEVKGFKAYLSSSAGIKGFTFEFSGITGINKAETDLQGKEIYDMQGRRVTQPQRHGIYVKDGKKVVF